MGRGYLQERLRTLSKNLLLHVCCAPDGTVPWTELIQDGYAVTAFFYGNNIHPHDEFLKREKAVLSLGSFIRGRVVTGAYEPQTWINSTLPYASCPERGRRCSRCFRLQLESAARMARKYGCEYLCTTLTISPHKDPGMINLIGQGIAARFGLVWVERIWRKRGGFQRSVEMSRELDLYRQDYCGCVYSIRGDDPEDE